ncbi:Phosphatidylglycerophosphatase A [Roseibaca ekhonensis]|uniref:Phosphatidylglycerophosphatase A n=1 Tax=Roseinatronobacter ekhonensis TaxID=254356 RepID=A0A3B0M7F0_9RHOB|nr:phosphatidylglycerophosphatase A [Roseibaca ekhonensis]SUZ31921.1 Phosphatidylglycerophosphatase A [Roseibaca ekhonensis]
MTLTRLIATFGGVGYLRPAPGTWGTLAALPVALALHSLGGFWLLLAGTFIAFGIGWWATISETRGRTDADPSEIVIDEVVGMWIALWPVSLGAMMQGVDVTALWPGWVAAFLAFRVFDIWKPGPVGLADRMHTPLGVMLDDVIAGALATLVVAVAAVVSHGMIGA